MELQSHTFQLRDFRLASIQAARTGDLATGSRLALQVDLTPRVQSAREVLAILHVSVTPEPALAFSLDIVGQARFETDTDTTTNDLEMFANTQAMVLMWPYLRESVSDLSARLGINPPVVLPILDVSGIVKTIYKILGEASNADSNS